MAKRLILASEVDLVRSLRSLLIALSLVLMTVAPAPARADGPAALQVIQSAHWTISAPPPAPLQAVQMLVEFEPGASVEPHHHGGVAYITVLDGTITLENRGREQEFERGMAFVEVPTEVYAAWNSGSERVRLLVTYLIPTGNPLTTLEDFGPTEGLPPGPQVPYQATVDLASRPASFGFWHLLVRMQPGAAAKPAAAAGDTFVVVFAGRLTVDGPDGAATYGPGDTVTISAGSITSWSNVGAETVEAGVSVMTPLGTGDTAN